MSDVQARIYKPAKNAMQSAWGNSKRWALEFEPTGRRENDRLMGWTGSNDTRSSQVHLRFETKEQAIAYAERHGLSYKVWEPKVRAIKPKSYAANFDPERVL